MQCLHNKWSRIAPAPDLAAVTARGNTQKVDQGPDPRPFAQTQIEVIHVAPKPATADADPVASTFGHCLPRRAADEQRGEVDAGVDSQLK